MLRAARASAHCPTTTPCKVGTTVVGVSQAGGCESGRVSATLRSHRWEGRGGEQSWSPQLAVPPALAGRHQVETTRRSGAGEHFVNLRRNGSEQGSGQPSGAPYVWGDLFNLSGPPQGHYL